MKKSHSFTVCYIAFVLIAFVSFPQLASGKKDQQKQIMAPDFPPAFVWLNTSEKLSLAKLKGHVVLLFFWTYSNINSLHVLPDMEALMEKYQDKPFYVAGVHSGKFYNEQDPDNVGAALFRFHVSFPVIVDHKYAIWKRYGIKAWPTYMLVGSEGNVMGVISGEKRFKPLDDMIAAALKQGKKSKTLAEERLNITAPQLEKKQLSFPTKLAIDAENNRLYIADTGHRQIVEVELNSPDKGKILHRIGSGKKALEDGDYSTASFNRPQGVAVHDGTLYVADMGNHALRSIDLKTKKVNTLIGNGESGGFGIPNSPADLVYYEGKLTIAMSGNHQLWTLKPGEKEMKLYVGNGYQRPEIVDGSSLGTSLSQPSGITVDQVNKMLYFTDSAVSAVRSVALADGTVKTLVGKGMYEYGFADGTPDKASMQFPLGVCVGNNKIYVADTFNNALREIDIKSGELLTLVLRANKSKSSANIAGIEHKDILPLWEPNDVEFLNNHVYIADTNHHQIRVYDTAEKTLKTLTISE